MATKKGVKSQRKPRGRSSNSEAAGGAGKPLVIWGHHACHEAITNRRRTVISIMVGRQAPQWLLSSLAEAADAGIIRPKPQERTKDDLEALVAPQAVHQGAVLFAEPLPTPSLDDLISTALTKETALIVVLDQVVDPHNVGAIVRSAAAFGALAVIVQDRNAPPLNGTLFKSACGGCEHVPILSVTNIARALKKLNESGVVTIGFAERAQTDLRMVAPAPHSTIVLGAEGTGLRRLVSETCNTLVKLSTPGCISTLNVSNAAAIALYQIADRQRFGNP